MSASATTASRTAQGTARSKVQAHGRAQRVHQYLLRRAVRHPHTGRQLSQCLAHAQQLYRSLMEQHIHITNAAASQLHPGADPRIQMKFDPGSISLSALLSKKYLGVPTAHEGHKLARTHAGERCHHLESVYGPNNLEQPPEPSLMLSYILKQFDDIKLVSILLAVDVVSALFGLLEPKEEILVSGNCRRCTRLCILHATVL